MTIEEKLNALIQTPSDINEHLATLKNYTARMLHWVKIGNLKVLAYGKQLKTFWQNFQLGN